MYARIHAIGEMLGTAPVTLAVLGGLLVVAGIVAKRLIRRFRRDFTLRLPAVVISEIIDRGVSGGYSRPYYRPTARFVTPNGDTIVAQSSVATRHPHQTGSRITILCYPTDPRKFILEDSHALVGTLGSMGIVIGSMMVVAGVIMLALAS